jgi:ABC-type Fe3+/spermidine/putrescine transport system ATPase subunit
VYERPESSFVAAFLGEANLLPARRDGSAVAGPGGARLEAGAGVLAAPEGLLFVRPEKVSIAAGGAGEGPNILPGQVRHASFLGNIVRYAVEVAEGSTVLCDAANGAGTVIHNPGDPVRLSWRAEDSRLLAA